MADVFDKINAYIAKLPDAISKGVAAVTIRAVDRYAWAFFERVKADAPFMRLRGSIDLVETFRKGKYGYRLIFDGKDENNTPLQMIANVFEYGRAAGSGVAETGRRYAYGRIEGIRFMAKNLELLKGIDREIGENMNIGGWSVSDDKITTSDGTTFSWTDIERYDKKLQGGA